MQRISTRHRRQILRCLNSVPDDLDQTKSREAYASFRRTALKILAHLRVRNHLTNTHTVVDSSSSEINGILQSCCRYNNLAMARVALWLGADVNCRDQVDRTPLILCAFRGSDDLCGLLINHGADVGATAINGLTSLDRAIESRQERIVRRLIRYGADVRGCQVGGQSLVALSVSNPRILRSLLAHGADPGIVTSNGYFPLFYAAQNDYLRAASLLLEYGADPNQARPLSGVTALVNAVRFGCLRLARFLLDRGADPRARFYDGRSILEYAIDEEKPDVEEMIHAYL